jgi:hypothetical protein
MEAEYFDMPDWEYDRTVRLGTRAAQALDKANETRCADCGEWGEMTGHMECQYPQDRD